MGREAFLFLTDKQDDITMEVFDRFNSETLNRGEPTLLFHRKTSTPPVCTQQRNTFLFTDDELMELKYQPIATSLIPGSNHFPVLKFFKKYPHFDYYWCIEDDVRFNGDWVKFFRSFNRVKHDFISSHLRRYYQEPKWPWWLTLRHSQMDIPLENLIRSFNPIYRLSAPALAFIHEALSNGWQGHHEVLLPTLLYREGFSIADFGGSGDFVSKRNKNRFYTSSDDADGQLFEGTMRFRPLWEAVGNEKNKLYHPVKVAVPEMR